jgi:hypothetical protein
MKPYKFYACSDAGVVHPTLANCKNVVCSIRKTCAVRGKKRKDPKPN